MICFFCGRFTVPGWGPGWNVFSEGTEKWTQWHFLCEVYSRQHLKGHCSCSPNPADMVRPQQILSCGRQLAKLAAGSFSTTHNTPPLWFGEPSRRNGHSSVLWAQACRRCPFLPSDCRTELSPRCLSVSLDSGAYLGNAVIVFGSSSNANMFGVAFTCVTSWIWCSLLASWAPAHVWDTHINKRAS